MKENTVVSYKCAVSPFKEAKLQRGAKSSLKHFTVPSVLVVSEYFSVRNHQAVAGPFIIRLTEHLTRLLDGPLYTDAHTHTPGVSLTRTVCICMCEHLAKSLSPWENVCATSLCYPCRVSACLDLQLRFSSVTMRNCQSGASH